MDITRALREATKEAGWNKTKLAAAAGVTEGAAHKWLHENAIPSGDRLLTLMFELPSLSEKLGFSQLSEAA